MMRAQSPTLMSLVALLLLGGAEARAQQPEEVPRTLDPSGRTPVQRGAPPDPYAPPARQQPAPQPAQPAPGGAESGDAEAAEDTGYYHYDDIIGGPQRRTYTGGTRPDQHEVSRGDTLWDITGLYFGDPFEWPKVWSLNPHITNPHWIYPGDEVRLQGAGGEPDAEADADRDEVRVASAGDPPTTGRPQATTRSFLLRQIAFVERDELEVSAEVVGSPSERELLVAGDTVYLDGTAAGGLRPGETYAIYADPEKVVHPHNGGVVGAYVRLLGELQIVGMREGERAVAEITSSVDAVERGARVGRLVRRFASVEATPPGADLTGAIVATIEIGELVGQDQLVVVDRGAADGVELGNPFFVVRRGDGFSRKMGPKSQVGQDDARFPTRIIGQIRVVEVSEDISLGLVMSAALEVGVGDHVIMRSDLE